ncbi:MAG: hypothetical protein WBA97_20395 [Actinophytocola sp.]|uniref:hypothetical protein n=1 Tax=Actinophytocola sp. TaxID=1872138 RepID=UPI003C75EBA0
MTTSTTRTRIARSDSTSDDRCDFYRDEFGLSATVDRATRRILMPVGGLIGAVTMPLDLGRRVQAGLQIRMLAGPVIERAQTQRWTFITGPRHTLSDVVHAELLRLGASVVPEGDNIVLPSPEDEQLGLWRWERALKALSDFPPQSAVIATTRAMAYAAR